MFNKSKTTLILWPESKETESKKYTIPESVVEIDHIAFEKCYGLTEIIIPIEVTTMGYHIFEKTDEKVLSIFVEAESIDVLLGWDDTC